MTDLEIIKSSIREIPDFPKPGILFRDITPIFLNPEALKAAIRLMKDRAKDLAPTKIAAMESRGFLFGAPLAHELGLGMILVRKPGKLPGETLKREYALEYGTDALEIHADAVTPQDRVLIVDDLLATGGTAQATAELIKQAGASVAGFIFLIELAGLEGRSRLNEAVHAIISYEGA